MIKLCTYRIHCNSRNTTSDANRLKIRPLDTRLRRRFRVQPEPTLRDEWLKVRPKWPLPPLPH
jgi:hypothetical protein